MDMVMILGICLISLGLAFSHIYFYLKGVKDGHKMVNNIVPTMNEVKSSVEEDEVAQGIMKYTGDDDE